MEGTGFASCSKASVPVESRAGLSLAVGVNKGETTNRARCFTLTLGLPAAESGAQSGRFML